MKIIEQKSFILTEEEKFQECFKSIKIANVSFIQMPDINNIIYWEFKGCTFNFSGTYSFDDWVFLGNISEFIKEKLIELKK